MAADLEAAGEDDEADTRPTEFMKKVEEALRLYIDTENCRREVADKHFNNPKRSDGEQILRIENRVTRNLTVL